MAIKITTEADPTPLVRLLAGTLRRASSTSVAGRLARMKGVACIRSLDDPQAATIRFVRGDIHLVHGVADDVQVSIAMDLENDGLPGAPKPVVEGAARHPRLALSLSKVLDPPVPGWQALADSFWRDIDGHPNLPSKVLVVATDSGEKHALGDGTDTPFEVHGPSDRLTKVFTGAAFLAEEAQAGRMHVSGSLAGLIGLTQAGILSALDLDSVPS